ncbi:MAG: hypothetical protein U0V48_17645 [Anaerolineales bacterium]
MGSKHENRISIIIVDDHEVVRNGIRSYIDTVKDFQVVAEAASLVRLSNSSPILSRTLSYST